MASSDVPVYFEMSWSILSTIGLVNTFIGFMVIAITGLSGLSILPSIVSAACALANGLCYYAYYTDCPKPARMGASVVADIAWEIQEAGLSFYSYQMLNSLLRHKARITFLCLFWALMLVILLLRVCILAFRAMDISTATNAMQGRIDHLHIGYFAAIAIVESCSSFLLRILLSAHHSSKIVFSRDGIWRQLIRSTEIRLATLCLVGILRAITYSFQTDAQMANSVTSQLDRFAYTLECLFPIVMM
ncbi:hypothetical protein AOQ84DRAFT_294995 [Glonium stellatum]|uniref:Uncharacterized protein n=1 Tax=Glonium stellatum TaxID=574774 RepID=A0A8E2EYX6_9PEZI|nr:hypothetical protein AOQ84DRAFT_294995 [Glonium stellatum]